MVCVFCFENSTGNSKFINNTKVRPPSIIFEQKERPQVFVYSQFYCLSTSTLQSKFLFQIISYPEITYSLLRKLSSLHERISDLVDLLTSYDFIRLFERTVRIDICLSMVLQVQHPVVQTFILHVSFDLFRNSQGIMLRW